MEVANASLLDEGTAAAEAMAMIARAVNNKVGGGVGVAVFFFFLGGGYFFLLFVFFWFLFLAVFFGC